MEWVIIVSNDVAIRKKSHSGCCRLIFPAGKDKTKRLNHVLYFPPTAQFTSNMLFAIPLY